MQKAKGYICEALKFGVESGYLTLKDNKGQLLKVSSDLLQSSDLSKGYGMKRFQTDDADVAAERRFARKRQRDSIEGCEEMDDVTDARKGRRMKKQRSQSGRSRRRSGKSRSRSKRKLGRRRAARR
jgi:hypothetical protein